MRTDVHTVKSEKTTPTVTVKEKAFPGKLPDVSVFSEKFEAANKVGRTVKGIRGRKSK
jgi:hypothetical protein